MSLDLLLSRGVEPSAAMDIIRLFREKGARLSLSSK